MTSLSRRAFLANSSVATVGLNLGLRRSAGALPLRSHQPVSTFFPERVEPATLRTLALAGVDAARRAGATYADIRVADTHMLDMMQSVVALPFSRMEFAYTYGLRVCVNGVWGFTFGVDPTKENVANSAQIAVETARGLSKIITPEPAMVTAPVVHGEWTTPVAVDPFAMSPEAHAALLGAYREAAGRVPDVTIPTVWVTWQAETRVFASTEGSLVTQRISRLKPRLTVAVVPPLAGWDKATVLSVPGLAPASAGFESAMGAGVQDRIKETAEEAARLARTPTSQAEFGRYEAVFDGVVTAAMVGATLGSALEMDRVLGYEANQSGTSFLAPINEILGQPFCSPLVQIAADRSLPHYGAVKWDDEGVATTSFPVIRNGRVINYFATRTSAAVFAEQAAKVGSPFTLCGSAVSCTPTMAPIGCASHLTMAADSKGPTLSALVQELSNGILVRDVSYLAPDQQAAGGLLIPRMIYEVKRGQITRRLLHGAMQFNAKKFWNAITAVGGTTTQMNYTGGVSRGKTWSTLPVVAPAARVTQLDMSSDHW
jgi:TldD protein